MNRLIRVRDIRNEWRAIGDGDESQRERISADIHRMAQMLAPTWVMHTKQDEVIETPVASKIFRHKTRDFKGYVEFIWLSRPKALYPVKGWYGLGVDIAGNLFSHTWRRKYDYSDDHWVWMPMPNIADSQISTAVLRGHILPYLEDLANH